MSSVSITTTTKNPDDTPESVVGTIEDNSIVSPAVGSFSRHPWVLVSVSGAFGINGGSATLSYVSVAQGIDFLDGISQSDVFLNGSGNGDLKVTVFDQGVHVDTIIITDFEDGIEVTGIPQGPLSPYTVERALSEPVQIGFIVTGQGVSIFETSSAYTFFFESLNFNGANIDLKSGVTITGDGTETQLRGFDQNDTTGQFYNDTLIGAMQMRLFTAMAAMTG